MLKNNQFSVSVIVPFYNEEQSISKVAKVLIKVDFLDEIIFVDDGSTDKSLVKIEPFLGDIKLVKSKRNRGKGTAMARGVRRADCDIVLFIDSDLETLTEEHLKTLVEPLLKKQSAWVLGYPMDVWTDIFFKDYGGQRAYFRKDLIPHLDEFTKTRKYGIEVLLNELFKHKKVKKVPLKGLGHLIKPKKRKDKDFTVEFVVWTMDVGRQLLKLKLINREEFRVLSKVKDAKSVETLRKYVGKFKYGKLKRYIYPYLKALIERESGK